MQRSGVRSSSAPPTPRAWIQSRPFFNHPFRGAHQDLEEAITFYLDQGAESAALALIDAFEQACSHLGCHPATGSPRYAHELDLPGLRFWPLGGYPVPRASRFLITYLFPLCPGTTGAA
ncbi:MAG: type II toxin-antitoxin system RelE/ParE family toxin [Wenzhouxiangellaceae bacterium]|nr:type II toxin-antitoxin system RelE/ParE family toxin [Wenzhouxiangellaceae bacterium]